MSLDLQAEDSEHSCCGNKLPHVVSSATCGLLPVHCQLAAQVADIVKAVLQQQLVQILFLAMQCDLEAAQMVMSAACAVKQQDCVLHLRLICLHSLVQLAMTHAPTISSAAGMA